MKNSISKFLALATILGISFAATQSQAQHYYQNSPSYGNNNGGNLIQSVHTLNQFGNQMTHNYGLEARNYCGCQNTAALLSEMRRYNGHTNTLINASRGTCPKTFKRASCSVRDSLSRIQSLRKRARVSHQVCGLISQSCPLSTYVHNNASSFRPVVHRPVQHQPACSTPSHSVTRNRGGNGGFDVRSAIVGAIAGRIIHGAIHKH